MSIADAMNLDDAIRLTEILLSIAFIQQSSEHLFGLSDERPHYGVRLCLSILLLIGVLPAWICAALLVNALFILRRFQGPYNGGSDLMSLLIIVSLCLVHLMPNAQWQGYVFVYLALQVIFSYFKSGWSKVIHRDWRTGQALQDVFAYSVYPISEAARAWTARPGLLCAASWGVIVFELLFPLALLSREALLVGLGIALAFHLANFVLFGFNRFVWVWLAAFPSLVWLQATLFPPG